jgi:DNA polymerase-1
MPGLDNVDLHLVQSVDDANQLLTWLGERHEGEVAADSETTGLVIEEDRVRLAQIGDSRVGWAVPWERWGGVFEEAIKKYDGRLIAHNSTYDLAMLDGEGLRIDRGRVEDTMMAAHVLDPIQSVALKPLAARFVDKRAAHLQGELANTDWTWATVPIDYQPYWTYGALDPVLTSQLHGVLQPRLDSEGCRRAYELEVRASFVVERMERNGVPIDVEYATAKRAEFEERAERLAARCQADYGVRPSQNAAVAERLIADGLPLTQTTKTGAIQLDKEVLGDYVGHPLVDLVLEHRRLTKLSSTYLRHFDRERLHPSINSVGAREGKGRGVRTGRMSMNDPTFHNLPRKADASAEAIEVRNCVTAREGHTLLMVDFDQIEARVIAHILARLGDPGLVEAFNAPDDFFTTIARRIFEDDSLQKSDERRQRTKNFFYANGYGAQDPKLAATAGISMEQLHRVKHVLYPGIGAFGAYVQQVALQRSLEAGYPYVTSFLTGRRFRPEQGAGLYVLTNYLVQGVAAELFKLKLIELDNVGLGHLMILPIHDEVILEVPDEDLRDVARTVVTTMNDTTTMLAPITAGASTGRRWGQKTDYNPFNEEAA